MAGVVGRDGNSSGSFNQNDIPQSEKHGSVREYDVAGGYESEDEHTSLHRGLQSRQITMIAIGGAIGTGLIIGTYGFLPYFGMSVNN